MKRKKARPVDRAAFDRTSLISRADAVRLIAQEVGEPRTNVSHRVGYAVRTGKLEKAAPNQFAFGRLVAWAQDTWPDHFVGWPATRSVFGTFTARWHVGDVPIGGKAPPTTLDGWRKLAYQLDRDNAGLREEIDKLRRKLASEYGRRAPK